jgi:hypothetical protein
LANANAAGFFLHDAAGLPCIKLAGKGFLESIHALL